MIHPISFSKRSTAPKTQHQTSTTGAVAKPSPPPHVLRGGDGAEPCRRRGGCGQGRSRREERAAVEARAGGPHWSLGKI